MTTKPHVFPALLLALLLPICTLRQASASPASDAIHAVYARLDAAYDRRDVPGILALYAPDFVRYEASSTQNLAQTRQRLVDGLAETQTAKAITRIKSLTVKGDQVEATVVQRVDVTFPKPLPDLLPPYFKVEVSQETWRRTASGWLLTKTSDAPLRRELRLLGERDQALRWKMIAGSKDPALPAQMRAADAADRAQLKRIIRQSGWPGFDQVGTDGEQAAFLITQHSDEDKPFQRLCLPLLQAAVRGGQAKPDELALLTDRILRGEGKPQVYGTQFMTDTQGILVPQPMEDPTHVDQRRASVGLPPLAECAKQMQRIYHPGPKPAPSVPGK